MKSKPSGQSTHPGAAPLSAHAPALPRAPPACSKQGSGFLPAGFLAPEPTPRRVASLSAISPLQPLTGLWHSPCLAPTLVVQSTGSLAASGGINCGITTMDQVINALLTGRYISRIRDWKACPTAFGNPPWRQIPPHSESCPHRSPLPHRYLAGHSQEMSHSTSSPGPEVLRLINGSSTVWLR